MVWFSASKESPCSSKVRARCTSLARCGPLNLEADVFRRPHSINWNSAPEELPIRLTPQTESSFRERVSLVNDGVLVDCNRRVVLGGASERGRQSEGGTVRREKKANDG